MKYVASEIASMSKPFVPQCISSQSHRWRTKHQHNNGMYVCKRQICDRCYRMRIVSIDRQVGRLCWYYDADGERLPWLPGYPPYPAWRILNEEIAA